MATLHARTVRTHARTARARNACLRRDAQRVAMDITLGRVVLYQ